MSSDLLALQRALPMIADLPALILWGTKDGFYGEAELERLTSVFPNHTVKRLEGPGHFIQSDTPDEVAGSILEWSGLGR